MLKAFGLVQHSIKEAIFSSLNLLKQKESLVHKCWQERSTDISSPIGYWLSHWTCHLVPGFFEQWQREQAKGDRAKELATYLLAYPPFQKGRIWELPMDLVDTLQGIWAWAVLLVSSTKGVCCRKRSKGRLCCGKGWESKWSWWRLVSQDRKECSGEDLPRCCEGAIYVLHETQVARSLLKQVSIVVC